MSDTGRRPGRPRSEAARQAILTAAQEELLARGVGELTIEGIAARAGVGKQTIYRWWPSKADVVLDAMLDRAAADIPVPDEGSLLADLDAFLTSTFAMRDEQHPVLVGLMAQSIVDPAFGRAFRERFLAVRRATLRGLFERAVARGEVPAEASLALLVDMVYGVLWYRLLVEHEPLDDAVARDLAALVTRAAASS